MCSPPPRNFFFHKDFCIHAWLHSVHLLVHVELLERRVLIRTFFLILHLWVLSQTLPPSSTVVCFIRLEILVSWTRFRLELKTQTEESWKKYLAQWYFLCQDLDTILDIKKRSSHRKTTKINLQERRNFYWIGPAHNDVKPFFHHLCTKLQVHFQQITFLCQTKKERERD